MEGISVMLPSIDFDALESINPDTIGWLYCPDTVINYPVMMGGDNSYYLTHLPDGTEGKYGALFLDCEASLDDIHPLIYGHHMRDGSMFASLTNYGEQAYYESHPIVYLITRRTVYEIILFSGFETSDISQAFQRNFEDDAHYHEWLMWLREQSNFRADVPVNSSNHVLSLSTCAYSFNNARYILTGVMKPI